MKRACLLMKPANDEEKKTSLVHASIRTTLNSLDLLTRRWSSLAATNLRRTCSCCAQLREAMRIRAMKRAIVRNGRIDVGFTLPKARPLGAAGKARGFLLCRRLVRICSSSRSCALLLYGKKVILLVNWTSSARIKDEPWGNKRKGSGGEPTKRWQHQAAAG